MCPPLITRAQDPPLQSRAPDKFRFVADTRGASGRPGINLIVVPEDADEDGGWRHRALDRYTFVEWRRTVDALITRLDEEGLATEHVRDAMLYWDALWCALPSVLERGGGGGGDGGAGADGDSDDDDSDSDDEDTREQLRAWGFSPASIDAATNTTVEPDLLFLTEAVNTPTSDLDSVAAPPPFTCHHGTVRLRTLALQLAENLYYVHSARLRSLASFATLPEEICRCIHPASPLVEEAAAALLTLAEDVYAEGCVRCVFVAPPPHRRPVTGPPCLVSVDRTFSIRTCRPPPCLRASPNST